MWVGRHTIEDLLARATAAEAKYQATGLHAALQQQNFDWLANHVNRLEAERALLLERLLQIGVAVPVIGRAAPVLPIHAMGVPITDRPEHEEPGMAATAMQAGSFEDMGDVAASQFGVRHDPRTGAVIYST